jgi:SAM-dependent methyltransferase
MDLSKIEKLYSDNFKEFGYDAKSVGWGTKEKQYLRFSKLMQVVVDKNTKFTINELGCGYGELIKFLQSYKFNFNKYYGYDISQEMLAGFKAYIPDNNYELFLSPLIKTHADYTIASGIFNVKFNSDDLLWENHIKNTLQNMFEMSKIGMAFNLLTTYVDFRRENLYYADPVFYFDFCKKHFSRKVNLIHDYDLFEWTIHVYK